MIFHPFAILLFFLFLFGLFFLFLFVYVGLITIAFEKIGLGPGQIFGFLLLSLLGSQINIPVKRIKNDISYIEPVISFMGIRYRIPKASPRGTILAVNLGGAIVPFCLSLYLMVKWNMFLTPILCTVIVALITFKMARPVPGLGIAIPLFIPPIVSALVAVLVSPEGYAAVNAYISGTMGTLIGADIMHLKDIPRLKAPMASIGGAGTFDGIFLTGVIAVLLA